jgi:8-oxo-dGTP pyrophosphatase MutT (NUDIX family)/catechol 2,3-dioxygenase-like lactoylglutathione lyase family enzyme
VSAPVGGDRGPTGPVSPPAGDPSVVVHAAGGVVWRRTANGLEVVLVHRPRYDDWTLPKGKRERDESDEAAALREVEEESRIRGRLGPELAGTTYIDRSGRTKAVRYWAMTVAGGRAGGDNEVDEATWLPLADAREALTYARDRPVLDALPVALAAVTGLVVRGLDHIALHCEDVEVALGFWCGTLGLEAVRVEEWRTGSAPCPSVRVDAGTVIDLVSRQGPPGRGTQPPGLDHVCVVVDPTTDLGAVVASGVLDVVEGPVRRYGARGEGLSVYIRDPDGLVVELRHY